MNAQVRHSRLTDAHRVVDPLAMTVRDLALNERRLRRLRDEEMETFRDEADDLLTCDELKRQLSDQRKALKTLASHVQATTRDGAILQALIALNDELPLLSDHLPEDFLTSRAGHKFRDVNARLQRLLYSIVYSADDLGADLILLRDTMAPRGFHGIAQIEELDAAPSQ